MQLETERLILREFVEGDWREVLAYQSQPLYLRYYPWEGRKAEEVQAFVQRFIDQQKDRPRTKYQLVIEHRESGCLVGNCGIRLSSPSTHEGDIGYELAPDQWGHGYATEAATAMLAYGFQTLGLHRISAECIAENIASIRVLERLGMSLEGRLRDKERFGHRYWDVLSYAISRHEWKRQSISKSR